MPVSCFISQLSFQLTSFPCVSLYSAAPLCLCSLTPPRSSALLSDTTYLPHADTSYLPRSFPNFLFAFLQNFFAVFWNRRYKWDESGEISLFSCLWILFIIEVMPVPLSCYLSQIKISFITWISKLNFEEKLFFFPLISTQWCVILGCIQRPPLLSLTPQVGGAVRGCRLWDQPHPTSLLRGATGVRAPTGTPPLQLCRTLPQIQTSLPL